MKNVLITGGSRGIGAECVRSFAKAGYEVYFTYNNSEEMAHHVAEDAAATALKCDISSADAIKAVISEVGNIDILINNAGISQIKMFQDITESDWDNMFNINVRGMFLVTQGVIGNMIHNKWGRIINISSMWGETGASCEVHYSASKAAVIGFTKALAKELGPSGITVNSISPGVIDTDMNCHLTQNELDELCYETPMGRIGKPCEIAKAALYLADESSGFITGADIPINGGIII